MKRLHEFTSPLGEFNKAYAQEEENARAAARLARLNYRNAKREYKYIKQGVSDNPAIADLQQKLHDESYVRRGAGVGAGLGLLGGVAAGADGFARGGVPGVILGSGVGALLGAYGGMQVGGRIRKNKDKNLSANLKTVLRELDVRSARSLVVAKNIAKQAKVKPAVRKLRVDSLPDAPWAGPGWKVFKPSSSEMRSSLPRQSGAAWLMSADLKPALRELAARSGRIVEFGDGEADEAVLAALKAAASADESPAQRAMLLKRGLVEMVRGQVVITERGYDMMQKAGMPPKLTPEERREEIMGTEEKRLSRFEFARGDYAIPAMKKILNSPSDRHLHEVPGLVGALRGDSAKMQAHYAALGKRNKYYASMAEGAARPGVLRHLRSWAAGAIREARNA
jgi:hypothetical protein